MESLSDVTTPIGTLAELAEVGADPTRIASCSKRTGQAAGGNKGCPYFRQCRFKPWRDQVEGLKGPLNIGVEIILAPVDGGAHNQMQMSCFNYFATNMRARARASDETGEIIRVVAYEGGKGQIAERCTRSMPPDATHKNGYVVPYLHTHAITPFVRPAERFPVEVSRQAVREEMLDEIERAALSDALDRSGAKRAHPAAAPAPTFVDVPQDDDDAVDMDFKGPVGEPRKVKGK